MTVEPLCITCGYWVATIGDQCDMCRHGDPFVGLEAQLVAAAIVWRRSLVPATRRASEAATDGLADAVDRLLEAEL